MNGKIKELLGVLACGVCNEIDCGQCRELFECEDGHPCDWCEPKYRAGVVEKFLYLLKDDNNDYTDISIEGLIDILKSE